MLTSSGALAAYDSRTPCSNHSCGQLGYLLQATTYIAGISGGSWLVMSNLVNDFRPVYDLVHDDKTWTLQQKLLEGVPNFDPTSVKDQIIQSETVKETPPPAPTSTTWGFADTILKFFRLGKTSLLTGTSVGRNNEVKNMVKLLFMKSTGKSSKNSVAEAFKFFKNLQIEVRAKKQAGFPISFTDYWGRALARKLFQFLYRVPGITLSSCTKLPSFQTYQQPYPLICSVEGTLDPKEKTDRIFEFSAYEFGSWGLKAFVKLKYLGTSLYNGYPTITTENTNISICTSGYDNVGFIIATSSSIFNQVFLYLYKILMKVNQDASKGIFTVLAAFGLGNSPTHVDFALVSPNPFYGLFAAKNSTIAAARNLYLADGGDRGENIPFDSLLVKARRVDIILAFDMTSDLNNFPNGTSLTASAKRYHRLLSTRSSKYRNFTSMPLFPYVPTPKEVLENGLDRPMFLGCSLSDYPGMTSDFPGILLRNSLALPPLIVYTPNYSHSFPSNTSTFQLSYTSDEALQMISNGYNMATSKNSTAWAQCLGCAVLKRLFDRQGLATPSACAECFQSYCYRRLKSEVVLLPAFVE